MTSPVHNVNLKNRLLAGVLAFLCPGAGHFYQKRFFKSFVFAIGVWGSWWTGMAMSDWKALQGPPIEKKARIAVVLKFGGQAGVGLPALWALYQSERYYGEGNQSPDTISGPQEFAFTGSVNLREPTGNQSGEVSGTVSLVPAQSDFGPAIAGTFSGTLNGQPITLKLDDNAKLGVPIRSARRNSLTATVVNDNDQYIGELTGTVPRPFLNWFACPLDQAEEAEWHRDRGKFQELAMVFVWVAGLMNLLAIWDAVEGPAYGYNDETTPPTPSPAV